MKRPALSIGIPLCLLFLFIVIILGSASRAMRPQVVFRHNYYGVIGDITIGMTLISDRGDELGFPGKITRTYFYVKWLKDIEIRGTVDNERNFVLYEYDKTGNTTGSFKGQFSKSDSEGLIGTWSAPDGTGGKPFKLALDNVAGGEIGKRYIVAGVEDDPA